MESNNQSSIVWLLKDDQDIVIQAKFRRTHARRPDIYLEYKVELPEPSDSVTPFADLTEEQVMGWLTDTVGVLFEPIDSALQWHYDSMTANTEVAQLPWA